MNFLRDLLRNLSYLRPLLVSFFLFKNERFILKSYEGSKKKGTESLFCLFHNTLWFVALNLPLLKYSSALPVFTTKAFLLKGTSCHFFVFRFWTWRPPFLFWYKTVKIPLSTCVSHPSATPSCFDISTGLDWFG